MFCDQCGMHLQAGQTECAQCGKPVRGPLGFPRNRVREHVQLLGILWMAFSAFHLLGGVIIILIGKLVVVRIGSMPNGPPPEVMEWLPGLVCAFGWLIVAKAAVGFVAGWGLLKREEWGRVVSLVVGFLALLNVPIGTALGIYTLWVLLPSHSEQDYNALARAA